MTSLFSLIETKKSVNGQFNTQKTGEKRVTVSLRIGCRSKNSGKAIIWLPFVTSFGRLLIRKWGLYGIQLHTGICRLLSGSTC
jgi:hypothetical protein